MLKYIFKNNFMLKRVKYTTNYGNEETETFRVNNSNKILKFLEKNRNLDLIEEIKTVKIFRNVKFVSTDSVGEIQELRLDGDLYKSGKEVLDYIEENYNLLFIISIEKEEVEY